MRFLITGASGFIGFPLVEKIVGQFGKENVQLLLPPYSIYPTEIERRKELEGYALDIVEHDLLKDDLDPATVKPFDVLFHLAAHTATEVESPAVAVNDEGIRRLLEALGDRLSGTRFVYTGTMASVDRLVPENSLQSEDWPCHPRTAYGSTKLEGERIILRHAESLGFDWTILRLPTVYGPGFRPGGMFEVIADGLEQGSLSTRIAWPGRMSMIYLGDVVDALIRLGTEDVGRNALYHISSGEDPSLDELIDEIARLLELKRKRIVLPGWCWAIIRSIAWSPTLMRLLPFNLRIAVWRVSLVVVDGMVADATRFNKAVGLDYLSLTEGLEYTYNIKRDDRAERRAVTQS